MKKEQNKASPTSEPMISLKISILDCTRVAQITPLFCHLYICGYHKVVFFITLFDHMAQVAAQYGVTYHPLIGAIRTMNVHSVIPWTNKHHSTLTGKNNSCWIMCDNVQGSMCKPSIFPIETRIWTGEFKW